MMEKDEEGVPNPRGRRLLEISASASAREKRQQGRGRTRSAPLIV